ncbi:MAG: DNA polymerase III subunit delta [Deltaproteobacteria bacterium]|nr:DNA polymerase III subunit delta [Deltaproteobacteria bacterium]
MGRDLQPEQFLTQLRKGQLSPFYLFYGESEFQLEKVLDRVRETFIPEDVRDFNLQIFYGHKGNIAGQSGPGDIIDAARSLPFMAQNRLIIVRRIEEFPASELEIFLSYLERAAESTCLIFISSKPDFRTKFYKKIRDLKKAVNFRKLYDNEVVPWIKKTAKDMGLKIDTRACEYLREIVGIRMRDLHTELEKLYLRYGDTTVGIEEVRELAIYSRIYTIFELMDAISSRQGAKSLSVLNKFIEEEGRDGIFRAVGMLNRQILLLWQTRSIINKGGRTSDVLHKLRLRDFQVNKLVPQSKEWTTDELEKAIHFLYEADGLLKSGSEPQLILENVLLSLCAR